MNSDRVSFALLLSVLLMVGQWPLSVVGESLKDDRSSHCHAQADGERQWAADTMDNACHSDHNLGHCSQGCDCESACTGCSATLVGIHVERFQAGGATSATPFLSLSDGLSSRTISPAERPPRFLFD